MTRKNTMLKSMLKYERHSSGLLPAQPRLRRGAADPTKLGPSGQLSETGLRGDLLRGGTPSLGINPMPRMKMEVV